MINVALVKRKIDFIRADLAKLEPYRAWTFDQIASDYVVHKAVERMIEIVVGEAIDINQHVIAHSPKRNLPFDFKESFLLLSDLGIYPKEFAEKIANSVGLRNILVHQYRSLDEEVFYRSIKDCLTDYTVYCSYVLAYLDELGKSRG